MRDDDTTIEISSPGHGTSGPISSKEFNRRVKQFSLRLKEGIKKMAANSKLQTQNSKLYDDKPDYWRDTSLDKIAEELRNRYHEHLHDAEISYLMTKKPMSRGGKIIDGKAKRLSGLLAFYSHADFIIIIQGAAWDEADVKKRRALVDHELKHCASEEDEKTGETAWVMRRHDIEEFTDIIDRHGLWHDGLKIFGQAVMRQLELPLTANEKAKEKTSAAGAL